MTRIVQQGVSALRRLSCHVVSVAFAAMLLPAASVAQTATPMPVAPAINSPTPGPWPLEHHAVSLRLMSSAGTYRTGEPVMLQVRATNETSRTLTLSANAVWHIIDIRVLDAAGQVVKPKFGPYYLDWHVALPYMTWPSKAMMVLDGPGHQGDQVVLKWIDLAMWGYTPLAPGRYVISATPELRIDEMYPDHFFAVGDVSNAVTIRILDGVK